MYADHRALIPADSLDGALRVMAEDGSFRVIALSAPDSVQAAILAQQVEGPDAQALGELLLGAAMIRETMSPGQRLQMVIGGEGSVAADTHPGGMTRGIVRRPEDGPLDLDSNAQMQVMRALYDGRLHQGILEIEPGKGISYALQKYLALSEQVESLVQVCVIVEGKSVKMAVGYLVQRLPEANEAQILKMLDHEAALPPLREVMRDTDRGADARAWMVARLLGDIPYVTLEETEVFFGCNCSHERVLGAITTLGREELMDIIQKREALQTDCDYCGAHYEVGVEILRGMLDTQ